MTPITVLIADDIAATREDIKRLLYFEEDIEVVGEAGDGEEAVILASELKPDVVLMDVNMPRVDGIEATERISVNVPQCAIIIISIQGEQEYLRRAMAAGARDYLVKPFSAQDLAKAIYRVSESQRKRNIFLSPSLSAVSTSSIRAKKGTIISFFCTKGGVGKTTLACNTAVALAQDYKKKVVLVDLDLSSGDVAVMLNLNPKNTIADMVQEQDTLDSPLVESFLVQHLSGLKVLPAPLSPEHAELVKAEHIQQLLKILKDNYECVIIDTAPVYTDINLNVLEASDRILLPLNQDLTTLKHVKKAQEILAALNYDSKIRTVLSQHSSEGLKIKELQKNLGISLSAIVPEDFKTVRNAINKGVPFVMNQQHTKVAQSIGKLIEALDIAKPREAAANPKPSFITRMFSL
ncbi:MAG: response regulator [Tepidanaerobacteraceae bacterium]|jgi:pilus assembly protein CpaE|nr:MinD/ParA family protein [Tepidanaerobacter sp.]HQA61026.1 response regulator [Tepidanaerobacteraceae bacterium]HQE06053.1 response regulator [Tepidanaerobacteraceae bacterium]